MKAAGEIVINLRAFKSFVFIYISAKLWNVLLVYFSLKRCPYAVYLCFQVPIRAFWVMVITVMEFQLFSWKKNQNARQLLHQAFTMCRLFPRMPLYFCYFLMSPWSIPLWECIFPTFSNVCPRSNPFSQWYGLFEVAITWANPSRYLSLGARPGSFKENNETFGAFGEI